MLKLLVNGQSFIGWETATITRSISNLSATFGLTVSDRFNGSPWRIKPGDSCQLLFNSIPVVTGYVDQTTVAYNGNSKTISITGRSKVADLVDCSTSPKQYRGFDLAQIAADMINPFGLKVVNNVSGLKLIPTYKPDEGATIFTALEKLARIAGVLLTDNATGDLVITRVGSTISNTILALGKNILACNALFDHRDRYSQYTVKSQTKGDDFVSGASTAHISVVENDSQITRYRPLTITAEDQADLASVKDRAIWEKNTRWGSSQSIQYVVQGWLAHGVLWDTNTKVKVSDSILGISDTLLISEVNYSLDDQGTLAHLRLSPPKGFGIEPITGSGSNKAKAIKWDF